LALVPGIGRTGVHAGIAMSASYVHGAATTPLLGDTIGGALNRAAARFSSRDALISCHQGVSYSYAELLQAVNRVARALLELGVARGQRIGIWSPNNAEWMITQYAAAKIGAVLVNINPAYRPRELEYALNQSGVSVLIAARAFRKTDYVEILLRLIPELARTKAGEPLQTRRVPALRQIVYIGADAHPGGIAWTDFVEMDALVPESDLDARERTLQFDDGINIQYTSGATGSPKGATLSHHNILNNGFSHRSTRPSLAGRSAG
jgi:fatty-acyl-CoA synthase